MKYISESIIKFKTDTIMEFDLFYTYFTANSILNSEYIRSTGLYLEFNDLDSVKDELNKFIKFYSRIHFNVNPGDDAFTYVNNEIQLKVIRTTKNGKLECISSTDNKTRYYKKFDVYKYNDEN